MSDVSDLLLKAMKDTQPDEQPVTRLAEVTSVYGGNTCAVRFDGETAISGRAYVRTYAGPAVGDRVVMLRVGSTWVAVGKITPFAVTSTVPGNYSGNLASNTSVAYKTGNVVTVNVECTIGGSTQAANAGVLLLDSLYWPIKTVHQFGIDGATGGTVPVYVNTSGLMCFVFARAANAITTATLTYVTTA